VLKERQSGSHFGCRFFVYAFVSARTILVRHCVFLRGEYNLCAAGNFFISGGSEEVKDHK
jgi:hypothetical protein